MKIRVKETLTLLFLALPCIVVARKLAPEVEYAMAYGAEAKICLKVFDDAGAPVSNASVRAAFDMLPDPHSTYGKTDTNGICVVNGTTNGNNIEFMVGKDGYYGSSKKITFVKMGTEHAVQDGKWQPYGDVQKIVLRRMINPCSLVDTEKWISVPRTNEWLRFDMRIGDFVHPYGTGKKSDFEVKVEWDGLSASQCRLCTATVRFVAEKCGGYFARKSEESEFPFDYQVNTSKIFDVSFEAINRNGDFHQTHHPFPKNEVFVTRTRCEFNANGEMVSANYGVVRRFDIYPSRNSVAIIDYSGAFNPTPNDTNLEDIEIAKRSRHFIRQCEPPPPSPKKKRKTIWPF